MSESNRANTYTTEFKDSAVQLALTSKQSVAQTAKELGLSKNTLYGWVRQKQKQNPKVNTSPSPQDPVQEELKRLRKEVTQLREERDILKKALAYFARQSP